MKRFVFAALVIALALTSCSPNWTVPPDAVEPLITLGWTSDSTDGCECLYDWLGFRHPITEH